MIQRIANYREELERNDTEEKEGMMYRIRKEMIQRVGR